MRLMAHHLDKVLATYLADRGRWEEFLAAVGKSHNDGFSSWVGETIPRAVQKKDKINLSISYEDSLCSPSRSARCKACSLVSAGDPSALQILKSPLFGRYDIAHAQRRLDDFAYDRFIRVEHKLEESGILLYYGLAPGTHPFERVIDAVKATQQRAQACARKNALFGIITPLTHERSLEFKRLFPEGRRFESLLDRFLEVIDAEDQSAAICALQEDYPSLWTAGDREFYRLATAQRC